MDASELHARSLNAKEVLTTMKNEKFVFPVADGTVKISGGDRRLRTSTLIRDRPERGEEQETLRGKSGRHSSPSPHQHDSTRDDAEAKYDFWSITGYFIYRHHVAPRVKLYMPATQRTMYHSFPWFIYEFLNCIFIYFSCIFIAGNCDCNGNSRNKKK